MRTVFYTSDRKRKDFMSSIDWTVACRLYLEAHLTTTEVAQTLGCSQPYVHEHLTRCGVPLRTRAESLKLKQCRDAQATEELIKKIVCSSSDRVGRGNPAANDEDNGTFQPQQSQIVDLLAAVSQKPYKDKPYAVNEEFFKTFTPEMLWVLGLLYTDGHMDQNRAKFSLTSVDHDMLEQVRQLLGFEGSLKRVNNISVAKRLEICRKSICNDLLQLGVYPAKTFSLTWPQVPKYLTRHFVRGCWDGDGGFSLGKDGNTLCANFTGGSTQFMEAMFTELSTLECFRSGQYVLSKRFEGPAERVIQGRKSVSNGYWVISFAGQGALEEFYWYLYESVPANLRLGRKHDLLRDFLSRKNRMKMTVKHHQELPLAA